MEQARCRTAFRLVRNCNARSVVVLQLDVHAYAFLSHGLRPTVSLFPGDEVCTPLSEPIAVMLKR